MALISGAKLGPYEIQSPLGAGGMGEVYRARDARLGRDIAIKVLAQHLSANPELRERFEREARAISSLNHPRICILHDVGHQDGIDFLVMEYLDGESLAERLKKGPLPLKESLKIAMEVCEALETAHRAGIIHRDLKPGNIMLTKTGAKLMDFGLAKAMTAGPGSGTTKATLLSAPVTLTMDAASPLSPLTTAGAIIGTIQYMSPEQIEGKEADVRSDLFALGAVLYELTTGNRPFEGKSQISVASAILEKDPEPVSAARPLTPLPFEQLITACLAKNPDDRIQSAHDVRLQLKWIAEAETKGRNRPEKKNRSREGMAWLAACALAVMLVASGIWWRASKPAEPTTYFSAPLPFSARDVAVSPNGHTVAVVGYRESERKNILWIYEPGSQQATSLINTEGANFPFWSPDGRSLGFFADGKLKKMDFSGGPVQTLCEAPTGRGGAWNKDGLILFTPSGLLGTGLYRIPASGGTPTQVTFPDRNQGEDSHRWPIFLPDGVHYLFLAMNLSGRKDLYTIFMGSLNSDEKRLIVRTRANVAYAAPGYLLFYRDQTLFAQRFDPKRFELTGEPAPILTEIQYFPRIAKALFATSDAGLLVAQKSSDTGTSQLLWFDRKGQQIGTAMKQGTSALYGNLFLSPNGKLLATDTTDPASQNTDIWTYDLGNGSAKRLTFDPSIDTMPIWSPDSTRFVFASNRELKFDLYLKDANGGQDEKVIAKDGPDIFPNDWSHDGKYVLYERGADLWFLRLPEQNSSQFLKAPSTIKNGRFSPDGKWVAYASNESGRWEIYVTSFPEARGKWQLSNGGGDQPKWRGDGKELFYLSPEGKIMAASVTTGTNFDTRAPMALFQANPREGIATSEQVSYDISKDGQRFLINTQQKQGDSMPMSVVLNWPAKLNK
jgi:serine/threonine protein kinase